MLLHVDGFTGTGGSDEDDVELVCDELVQDVRIPYGVDSGHNDVGVFEIWVQRLLLNGLEPRHPLQRVLVEHEVVNRSSSSFREGLEDAWRRCFGIRHVQFQFRIHIALGQAPQLVVEAGAAVFVGGGADRPDEAEEEDALQPRVLLLIRPFLVQSRAVLGQFRIQMTRDEAHTRNGEVDVGHGEWGLDPATRNPQARRHEEVEEAGE
mmetsp:Transcript_3269/g.5404  ORF Transcript_3269/g.5404 Transcript_3269/m.5404 type:complete len:208 (+) Transcript_3269:4842-5465(+)